MKIFSTVYDYQYNHPNFTSRSPQIRDAQWVCHILNTTFPHTSSSKFKLIFEHYIQKSDKKYSNLVFNSYSDISNFINKQVQKKDSNSLFNKIKSLFQTPEQKQEKKQKEKMFSIIKKNIDKIGILRKEEKSQFEKALYMISAHKVGNCQENAILAEFIMKLNGIKNAQSCILVQEGLDPHCVCIFNIDDTPYKEIIKNKTLIIDPWLGKADFANNMLKYYKNNCKDLLSFAEDKGIKLNDIPFVHLSDEDIKKYKTQFPQLIFKSKDHKFMQKQTKNDR